MSDERGAPPRAARWLLAAAALPALAAVALLGYTMLRRAGYPYDLEWMEGGLLHHAQRIADRQGIYVAPSVDFIPYLYTPLYPALLALLGKLVGISYVVGRAVSILAVLATLALIGAAIVRDGRAERQVAWTGAALAAGLYAATYPWVEGWFDLVRGDSLFLALALGGLFAVRCWARVPGSGGRWRIAAAGYLLALSFFCKQTGVLFCLTGAALLAAQAWRRLPIYLAMSGAVGLGGAWLFQRATGGWFRVYAFDILDGHESSGARFREAFGHILGHFPAMTATIAIGLGAVAVSRWRTGRLPPASAGLLYWAPVFAVACLVGALGWAHQTAHFNAYLPAMATGALACGAALPAIVASLRPRGARLAVAVGLLLAAGLAIDVARSLWRPSRFVPTARDRAAGDALIARLRAVEGDVLIPYHPWYAALAGKPVHVHRMGLLDLTRPRRLEIDGLDQAYAARAFSLIVLDDRPLGPELGRLSQHYRMDEVLPPGQRPRTYSGAIVEPRSLWRPRGPAPLPPGATPVFDFERGDLTGWEIEGSAWGRRPVRGPLPGQGPVYRFGGAAYVSSFHGGDGATGTLTSPPFALTSGRLRLLVSGGRDERRLRVELVVDGAVVRVATGAGSERMTEVVWSIAPLAGRSARLRLVDEATGGWGHLNVDEVLLLE